MLKYTIIVEGHVQGVGFRYCTMQLAQSLGLSGGVRNQDDGTVYIDVYGPEETITDFLKKMRTKAFNPIARITQIKYKVANEENPPTRFHYWN